MAYRFSISSSGTLLGGIRTAVFGSSNTYRIARSAIAKCNKVLARPCGRPLIQQVPLAAFSSASASSINLPLEETPSFAYEPDFADPEALFDETWTNPGTSLITSAEIQARQRNLLALTTSWLRARASTSSTKQSPLILIASNPPQFQAHTSIPVDNCKQNTDFTYFTGLHSGESDQLTSDCVLALFYEDPECADPSNSPHQAVLFAPTRTKSEQLWNGPDLASSSYRDQGFLGEVSTDVQPLSHLVEFVNSVVRSTRKDVFLSKNGLTYRPELVTHLKYYMIGMPKSGESEPQPNRSQELTWAERWSTAMSGAISSVNVRDASAFVDQLRGVKSTAEARALRRIGRIGARALKRTIEWSRERVHFDMQPQPISPFYESYIAAKFEFESRLSGAKRISFPSVCASGRRSTIIHYGRNDRAVKPASDWILTDVGAEDPDGYCSDISRTWPISLASSSSSSFQLRLHLYEALVGVQRRLMASIRVGETSLDDLYRVMQSELTKLLLAFNVFDETVVTSDGSHNVASLTRRICPHHVSHYIGLDIHDTPTLSRSKPLQPGMCFSIEPGLYFTKSSALPIKPEFRGIGLRVEDDLLIDPDTHALINLTADCPSL